MAEIETDERGRVTIPKPLRERFGDRYRLVELEDGIKLVPIPDDPVAALGDAASEELKAASMETLLEHADRAGREDAADHVR